jgi:hypothetical protein
MMYSFVLEQLLLALYYINLIRLEYYIASVSIALRYGLDDRGSRVRFPAGAGNFFSSLPRTERLWGPPSLLSNG